MKNRTLLYAGIALAVIIGLPIAYYLLSPLWINVPVDEPFPTAMSAEMSIQATQAMSTAMAEPDTVMEEAMPEPEMTLLAQGSFYNLSMWGVGRHWCINLPMVRASSACRILKWTMDLSCMSTSFRTTL